MKTVFVPGRANLIGEHLDYNGGSALPFAIQLGVTASCSELPNNAVSVISEGFGRWTRGEPVEQEWSRLAEVVVTALASSAQEISLSSTLPSGAGLSSSAAYLGALALILDVEGDLLSVSRFLQECERAGGHDVGLLDQISTLGARSAHALLIDFRDLSIRDVPISESLRFTAIDTGVRRELATTAYSLRRDECVEATRLIGELRGVSMDTIATIESPTLRRRALHVQTECRRVDDTVSALEQNDDRSVGILVSESHESLSQNFDVSTPQIDQLVRDLISQRGVYGARLVGGGFGGCVLVVHEPGVSFFSTRLTHWELRVGGGAFERIGRPRFFNESL